MLARVWFRNPAEEIGCDPFGKNGWVYVPIENNHRPREREPEEVKEMTPAFMFTTGIENSYPTIQQGRERVDELEK
jgi:hypothetical protein